MPFFAALALTAFSQPSEADDLPFPFSPNIQTVADEAVDQTLNMTERNLRPGDPKVAVEHGPTECPPDDPVCQATCERGFTEKNDDEDPPASDPPEKFVVSGPGPTQDDNGQTKVVAGYWTICVN